MPRENAVAPGCLVVQGQETTKNYSQTHLQEITRRIKMVVVDVVGDWPRCPERYIGFQANCLTVQTPAGEAASIAEVYPDANIYKTREALPRRNCAKEPDTPGTVRALASGSKIILCLLAQWGPWKPGFFIHAYPGTFADTTRIRRVYFQACVDAIDSNEYESPVAVTSEIGCGVIGGHWPFYREVLEKAKTTFMVYTASPP
jgi:hypothetical protein